jgi:hypothetical protein
MTISPNNINGKVNRCDASFCTKPLSVTSLIKARKAVLLKESTAVAIIVMMKKSL